MLSVEQAQKQHAAEVHARLMGRRIAPKPRAPIVRAPDLAGILADPLTTWKVGVNAILRECRLSIPAMTAKDRTREVVDCRRQIAKFLKSRDWTPAEIGNLINRDRTTILNLLNPDYRETKRNYRQRKISP